MTVIIGMDPHKRSATIEIVDPTARVLATGRYATDATGYGEMLNAAQQFPDRVWAVEGCNGIGRHLAHRLVHDGESVVDVPAKLSAQIRVFANGASACGVRGSTRPTPRPVAISSDPDHDHRNHAGLASVRTAMAGRPGQ